jgi:hypothetical protein
MASAINTQTIPLPKEFSLTIVSQAAPWSKSDFANPIAQA